MKIAFVIHHVNNWGGQERSTLEFISRCAEANEVHLFAYSADGLPPNVVFHKVPLLIGKPFFAKDFFFRLFVKFMMRTTDFDVINATGNCCLDSNVITIQFCQERWALERKKIPTPFSILTPVKAFQSIYDVIWEKIVYGRLKDKWYVALSETVAEDMRHFFGLKNVVVIPHGVDVNEFCPDPILREKTRKELGFKADEKVLLFVGTFERKGLFYLLPAFAKLANNFNAKLCVVGDGPIARAQKMCENLGILDRVHFAGFTREVPKFYQAADAFILPSMYDPFGLVGIEALASGLPSVVSIQSGSSSLIENGKNGYLLKNPSDLSEVESTLRLLLSNSAQLEQMKSNARKSVLNCTWDKVWSSYEEVFKRAASR